MLKTKKIVSRSRLFMLLLIASVSLLGLVFIMFFANNVSKAESSVSIESDLEVIVSEVIAFSLTNCDLTNSSVIKLEVTPTKEGIFKSNCQTTTVHTNSPGYSLIIKADTSTLNYQNPTTISPLPTISSTTGTIASPIALGNNTWGFAVEGGPNFDATYVSDNANNIFAELPTTDTTVYQTNQQPLPVTSHTFYYGTKLTTSMVAGTYANTITYTAVGAEVPEPIYYLTDVISRARVTTMQQLTSTLCSTAMYDNTNNGRNDNNTVVLTDTRNNQDYRIRKLADNRCWMIDNIKIANITLTPESSDVESNYNLIPAGFNMVDQYLNTPYVYDPVTNDTIGVARENCTNYVGIESTSITGCGYLYSWSAATAGTGDGMSTNGQNAAGSICPIGWHLPTGGVEGTMTSEYAILNGSMLANELASANWDNNATAQANWRSSGPFSGSYAGSFNAGWGYQGRAVSWWSSTAESNFRAYAARLDDTSLSAGNDMGPYRHVGRPVRCLL